MKKPILAMLVLGTLSVAFITGMAQPPGEKGPKKGPPPDKKGPGWEPGKIIPPHVRDALDLTEDQQRKISALEDDVRAKLLNIFTDEQKQRLKEMNSKGPKGPPKDKDFPPDKKGKGKGDKDKDRDRRDNEEVSVECSRSQIQRFETRLIEE